MLISLIFFYIFRRNLYINHTLNILSNRTNQKYIIMKKQITILVSLLFISFISFGQEIKAFHFTPDTTSLPDGSGVSYTTTIMVEGYLAGQTLAAPDELISICVDMEHSYLGDLVMEIVCPNDTSIILEAQGGGSTHLGEPVDAGPTDFNMVPGVGYDYCWTNYASNGTMAEAASVYSTLPPGDYTPFEPFSDLVGCPLNGPWTIIITDNWAADDGYIFNWGINFAANPGCFTMVTGRVFADVNGNNIYDSGDYPRPGITLKAEPGPYYGYTNSEGIYKMWLPTGSFTISELNVQAPWFQSFPTSPNYHSIEVLTDDYDTIPNIDFGNQASYYCPDLSVDVNLNPVVLCQTSNVYVNYQNNGTISNDNTIIQVELDEHMTYVSGGNLIDQTNNILSFDVGTVNIGQIGQFTFHIEYDCDQDLVGATACVASHIYPDDPCTEPDEGWDHSSVMVNGECVDDLEVCFTITNTGDPGDGDMQGTSEYRIYEDNSLVYTGYFQINGGEIQTICWPANGSTIRLEADQRPGHPGNSHPQETIELCGSPNNSIGYVLDVPQDDLDDFIEIDCYEVVVSYDPNDKSVIPQGIAQAHFVDTADILEYKIRFQNTGSAPAYDIYILDTISEYLDISTFRHMSSSHECSIEIVYPNIIKWTFENIMLHDSTHNEPESHGYVKFKIDQTPDNQYIDVITNSAAIYFDYNLPVITNQTFNTIGKYSDLVSPKPIIYSSKEDILVYPNPAKDFIYFELDKTQFSIEIYNIYGQLVKTCDANGLNVITIDTKELNSGMYIYSIKDNIGTLASGKVIIEK
ncbi:MAG: hypothetical protein C0596_11025 [Marinilabiliales bacterium]|nr:MAG: hypothetical protein C0596_11025 [Marinilabiliales bacterium]